MEKVVNKSFICDREVTLISERFGTKFYRDNVDNDIIYVANYDEVVAKINSNTYWIIDTDELAIKNEAN